MSVEECRRGSKTLALFQLVMFPVQEMAHIPDIVMPPSIFCTICTPAKLVSIKIIKERKARNLNIKMEKAAAQEKFSLKEKKETVFICVLKYFYLR